MNEQQHKGKAEKGSWSLTYLIAVMRNGEDDAKESYYVATVAGFSSG